MAKQKKSTPVKLRAKKIEKISEGEFIQIEISKLTTFQNVRKTLDEKSLKELELSIKQHGIISPLIITPWLKNKGTYEIICGHRRYEIAKRLKLQRVPAIIKELEDWEKQEIQLVENIQRADVHPLEESFFIKKLIKESGMTVDDLSIKIGKSANYIYKRMKLDDLIDSLKEAYKKDFITHSMASLLARQPAQDQKELFTYLECKKNRTTKNLSDLEYAIKEHYMLDLSKAPFDLNDADLVPVAGSCKLCPKRSGNDLALFDDIKSKNICSDRACFDQKRISLLERAKEEFRKKEGDPKLEIQDLSDNYYNYGDRNKKYLFQSNWSEVKKNDDRAKKIEFGIIVNSDSEKFGKVITFCRNENLIGSSGGKKSKKQIEIEKKEKLEKKENDQFNRELWNQIQINLSNRFLDDSDPLMLTSLEFRRILTYIIDRTENGLKIKYCRLNDIEIFIEKNSNYELKDYVKSINLWIDKQEKLLTDVESDEKRKQKSLARLYFGIMLEFTFLTDTFLSYTVDKGKELRNYCSKELKIDIKKLKSSLDKKEEKKKSQTILEASYEKIFGVDLEEFKKRFADSSLNELKKIKKELAQMSDDLKSKYADKINFLRSLIAEKK